jgi:SAM-dependent methyltransferase
MTRVRVAELILADGHKRVLDLPSGTGALTQMLLDGGVDVVSADLNPDGFVVQGRSCARVDLNAALPFVDGGFDAMACIEGIEHIENPHLLAREANRILKPGGRLYVSTPNVLSIRSRLSYLLRGYPDQFHYMIEVDQEKGIERPIAHINPIGFLELRYTLSRWGFRVDVVQTNRLLKQNSVLYRALRRLLLTRGKRSAASHPQVAQVRESLLSDAVLFGEGLIVGATKVPVREKPPGK